MCDLCYMIKAEQGAIHDLGYIAGVSLYLGKGVELG